MARRLLFAWLSAAFLLGGCGGGDEGVVLRFLEQPDPGGGWRQIIDAFEEDHPEIRVELVEGPAATDAREGLYATSLLSGDTTYDLVFMDVIWVPRFAAQGWLLPLDDRFPPGARADFLPGDIEGSIHDGRIYRVPMRSDAGVLYYRTDLVDSPPQTFDELVEIARRHQDPPQLWGFVFQGRQYEGLVTAFLEVLWGFGGDVLDESGNVVLDSPEGERALAWLAATVRDIAPEAVTTYQEEEARHAFQEGRAVFMRNWPYAWSRAQEEGSPVRGRIGIAPMVHAPGEESAATLGGWGFGIAANARHPDAAWEFIRFATSDRAMAIFHRENGALPARRAFYHDPDIVREHPHYPDLYEVLLRARPRPVHAKYPQISDAIQTHVSAALVGRQTPEVAVREAAARIRGILAD